MMKLKCLFVGSIIFLFGFKVLHKATPYRFPKLVLFPGMPFSEANPVTVEGVDLGRHLFYDPVLSGDSSLSCASCHRQEAAFSDAPIAFSKGNNGSVMGRNTLPLFNLAWYTSLFWDGRAVGLEEQVFHPVRAHEEMNLQWPIAVERIRSKEFYRRKFRAAFGNEEIDSVLIARAVAQFERTLLSYNSKYDSVVRGETVFTKEEFEGFELVNDMTRGDCLHCHSTDENALGTIPGFSDNGLDNVITPAAYKDKGRGTTTGHASDNGKFKIPSLRNLAFTAPYMHDGRFKTIDEVLDFYSEGVNHSINVDSKMGFARQKGARLSADEKRKIKAFLMTMNDMPFVRDTTFSNPFR